jgi:hypothetical protein
MRSSMNAYNRASIILFRKQKKPELALQQRSCAARRLSCIQTVAELLSHIYAMLHNALGNTWGLRSSFKNTCGCDVNTSYYQDRIRVSP